MEQQARVQPAGQKGPLGAEELRHMDAYWRAANYLSVGQIYLLDNPLLKESLKPEHAKPRLLGHWGTTPGLNFIYVHLNRIIKARDLDMIYVTGPGHGGPALVAQTWLEGSYSELYPHVTLDADGMRRLFKQFSFPGGVPSHTAAETPGSINEGGELGYSLAHAYGAAFDNPDLVVACVVGDGEAETGPLAAAWHSNKFLNPARDGAVLPILHLNGYKIANPTVLARIPRAELESLFVGYGYQPYFVEGAEPERMHQQMAATLDRIFDEIREIQQRARREGLAERPRCPMLILASPKGWTGPKELDGKKLEGHWRSHQVPFGEVRTKPEHLKVLEQWMKSYRPEELFDESGAPRSELRALAPEGNRRMGANPHANGGLLLKDLHLPDFRDYAVEVPRPGGVLGEATRTLGIFLRDVMKANAAARHFRVVGPDETASNRLGALFEVTGRAWVAERLPTDDDYLSPDGRVMEILSEHTCQGWLEGYLITGRHGLFSCYEAFIHIVDSMFNQHAKWLKVTREIPWRRPIASLNYLLTSHVWRQDHNGFSHQDPGFLDVVMNKKAEVVRVYLPPDTNTLLYIADQCLRSRNFVNVIVAGKQEQAQWLTMDQAIKHCTPGIGMWEWASNDKDGEPDVVMACAGDVPTLETLAAVDLIRQHLPSLKVRVINVVDLMTLQPKEEHPHGLSDREFDGLFTTDKPVLFTVNDNAYTNWMAHFNLEKAIWLGRWLAERHPERWEALSAALELTREEIGAWEEIARELYIPVPNDAGVIEQFEGYFDRRDYRPGDAERLRPPLERLFNAEEINASQLIKQADVLMLPFLFPEAFSREVLAANYRYYEPRTDHGSSLSPSVHAALAARLGLVDDARRYWRESLWLDLSNTMGNSALGVHAACMGGTWQALVFGFLGVRFTEDGPAVDAEAPGRLLEEWGAVALKLAHRGRVYPVRVARAEEGR